MVWGDPSHSGNLGSALEPKVLSERLLVKALAISSKPSKRAFLISVVELRLRLLLPLWDPDWDPWVSEPELLPLGGSRLSRLSGCSGSGISRDEDGLAFCEGRGGVEGWLD